MDVQWIFIQLFKKGLAYKKETTVNYCTGCKVVLANEEVVNGVCERCGSPVVQKNKSQWMLKITAYADRLINDLDDVDYIDRVKTQQRNWIGRSHGAEINFNTTAGDTLTVYTTRADTLFGATYMVISPEHAIKSGVDAGLIRNADAVAAYQEEAARKSDFGAHRAEQGKDRRCRRGRRRHQPAQRQGDPDLYLLTTSLANLRHRRAIMAVPAHDTCDWKFAKKFGLVGIIEGRSAGTVPSDLGTRRPSPMWLPARSVNSDFLNGLVR